MSATPWLPFDEAREIVSQQGFKKGADFFNWAARPRNIPSNPRQAYGDEWGGMAYWIGTGPRNSKPPGKRVPPRPFEAAREFARQLAAQHSMTNQQDWVRWAKAGNCPADIPNDPSKTFKGKGWAGWPDWLGRTPARASGKEPVRSFQAAREFARGLRLKGGCRAWKKWARGPDRPSDIPYSPEERYEGEGWIGWGDFLGEHTRWTHPEIVHFLDSLKPVVAHLSEVELYLILSKNKMLRRDARLVGAKLLRGLANVKTAEQLEAAKEQVLAEAGSGPVSSGGADDPDRVADEVPVECLRRTELAAEATLPALQCLDALRALDRVAEGHVTDDQEVLEFMVKSRVAMLWEQLTTRPDADQLLAELRTTLGGVYADKVREQFLAEYDAAAALPLPAGYDFRGGDGRLAQPNPMQRLTAYRLREQKRVGNWSGVGAGKTNAAILAAGTLAAELTVIFGANATLNEVWKRSIKKVFPGPEAEVHVKDPAAFRRQPGRMNFLVLNYEALQQPWSEEFVEQFTDREKVDFLILDEVQFARQRNASRSMRRELLETFIQKAAARAPDIRILAMSATPVVNHLREAVKLLELLFPEQDLSYVPVAPTVCNAMGVHQLLRRHGMRHRPPSSQRLHKYTPELDGHAVLPQLQGAQPRDLLRMEQVLLGPKLDHLTHWVRRGTLVYTHYVDGIVEPVGRALETAGLKAQYFTGQSRCSLQQFIEEFRAGRVDVLVGSQPVGTGVDGLQFVLDRVVFLTLPWSHAEYEQIVGRLYRQGAASDTVEVFIPQVVLREERAGIWSWDDLRLRCIEYKRTLADAAVDGVFPDGGLPSREELRRRSLASLDEWVERVSRGIPQGERQATADG